MYTSHHSLLNSSAAEEKFCQTMRLCPILNSFFQHEEMEMRNKTLLFY